MTPKEKSHAVIAAHLEARGETKTAFWGNVLPEAVHNNQKRQTLFDWFNKTKPDANAIGWALSIHEWVYAENTPEKAVLLDLAIILMPATYGDLELSTVAKAALR